MGVVMYAANVLGSRGPRKMQVAIPCKLSSALPWVVGFMFVFCECLAVDEFNQITKWRDGQGPPSGIGIAEDMLSRMKERNMRELVYLINKPPRWNEQVGAYVLNFNGRVTMASVKNFQLVDPEEQNSVVLQVSIPCIRWKWSLCCPFASPCLPGIF
jgi:tubby and related proteins